MKASLEVQLEPIRTEHKVPALAAAIVETGRVVASGVVGVRKIGDETKASLTDQFHIGSCTKSMTATLAALLIQDGILSWNTTMADALPELAETLHPDFRAATLEQLLSHRAGAFPFTAPGDDILLWRQIVTHKGSPVEQRRFFVEQAFSRPPVTSPGTAFAYSNAGYAAAGAMLEVVGGKPWETLIQERLFEPLGIDAVGFGAPGTPGNVIDQPRGHKKFLWMVQPVEPGPQSDNPPAISPAGRVNISIEDFARYAALHLRTARGDYSLLSKESAARLYTAHSDNGYAMGWVNIDDENMGGRVLVHDGSNGMFFAMIQIAPERDLAIVAATNQGDSHGRAAVVAAIAALAKCDAKWNHGSGEPRHVKP